MNAALLFSFKVYDKIKSLERRKKSKQNHKPKPAKRKIRTRAGIFSKSEVEIIRCKCEELIKGKLSMNEKNIRVALHGEDMLEKFVWTQIRTRIKYEKDM
jgi:hypothetical protein